jgi:uncharacterized protein DUF4214
MKALKLISTTAILLATSFSLNARGSIKTYVHEASFAADDSIDFAAAGNTSNGGTSVSGMVEVSGGTSPNGALTFFFASGPVRGVGVQIEGTAGAAFNGRITAYDVAGNLLGSATLSGRVTSLRADGVAPFMGIRSNTVEIAKVEIDANSAHGYTISGLKLAQKSVIDNHAFFVNQLFLDLYGRTPSASELAGYVNGLKDGSMTRVQVASTLFHSPEFHDNAGFLVKCYRALTGRDPEFLQWAQILKVMQGGVKQESALEAFMSTPEYAALYPAALSGNELIGRLHQNLLGRDASAAEMESWTAKLNQGTTRTAVVEEMLRSAEYEARIAGRVNTDLAYLAFLRRSGDAGAVERWSSQLNAGGSVVELLDEVLSQPEYLARF